VNLGEAKKQPTSTINYDRENSLYINSRLKYRDFTLKIKYSLVYLPGYTPFLF